MTPRGELSQDGLEATLEPTGILRYPSTLSIWLRDDSVLAVRRASQNQTPLSRPAVPMKPQSILFGAAIIALSACSSAEKSADAIADSLATTSEMAPAPVAAVQILSPAEGDTLTLPFTLTLGATGVEVIAANGLREEGKGHHHLMIDGDTPPSDSLPLAAAPVVIHLGTGATERILDSLTVGPHRIIAIFASGDHVPWTTVARDTVNFVVRK